MPTRDEEEFDAAWRIVKNAKREIAQRKRDKLVKQRDDLDRDILVLDRILGIGPDPLPEPEPVELELSASSANGSGSLRLSPGEIPTKPQGLLAVLAENPGLWKLSAARDVMVERGWLQPGEKGTHQIQNTAWTLKNRGHLESPRTGYYRITEAGKAVLGP